MRANREDDHVRIDRRICGLLLQDGIGEMVELPPGAMEVVIIQQLLRERIVQVERMVSRSGVFIRDDEIEWEFWIPGRAGNFFSCDRVFHTTIHVVLSPGTFRPPICVPVDANRRFQCRGRWFVNRAREESRKNGGIKQRARIRIPVPAEYGLPSSLALAELHRGRAGGGTKRAAEGAVIVEAARMRDFRDRLIRLQQQPRGGGQPGLRDELAGREAEDALDESGETDRGKSGASCQRCGEMFSSKCASRNSSVLARLEGMLSRSPGARRSREIPARPMIAPEGARSGSLVVRHQPDCRRAYSGVQAVDDRATSAQHGFILRRATRREVVRENVAHMASDELRLFSQATAFDE